MLDVIVFMPHVDSFIQMINPFNLSLDPGPESWPLVSLPPQKLGPHITRLTGSLKLRRLLSVCLHGGAVKHILAHNVEGRTLG